MIFFFFKDFAVSVLTSAISKRGLLCLRGHLKYGSDASEALMNLKIER